MKFCIIQHDYSTDYAKADELFEEGLALLDACDDSMDVIVLPEFCDLPAYARDYGEFTDSYARFNARVLQKAKETAVRCNAIVFINAARETPTGIRNTTYAINRAGEEVGYYYKQHLTPGEMFKYKMDADYTYEYEAPTVLELEGIRFAFLTCYDFYFYEMYPNIARQNVDVIIGCSHQRTDRQSAIGIINRFCAYNTNAYIVRASISMGKDSEIGGGSMIVAPDGTILADMGSRVGLATAELDPHAKYYKPAGFGNPPSAHYEYIEAGRRPWKYRPSGGAMIQPDKKLGYPRVCAHRGFSTVAPENSMPAYGAAVALGAEEIEFDLWETADGELVSIHDPVLERVSDGEGLVCDKTYAELLKLDFGVKFGEKFKGLQILRFEEILRKFAGQVIMNIHIKTQDEVKGDGDQSFSKPMVQKVLRLIDQYDCKKHCYLMCVNDALLCYAKELDPEIETCAGLQDYAPHGLVDRAIRFGYQKVQLFAQYLTQEEIDEAHAHGITVNVFFADDPDEARRMLDMGVDTILSNDYLKVATAVKAWKEEHRKNA